MLWVTIKGIVTGSLCLRKTKQVCGTRVKTRSSM